MKYTDKLSDETKALIKALAALALPPWMKGAGVMVYKPDKKQLKQARERLKDRKNRGTDDEYFKNLIEQLENGPWPTFVQQTKGARQERARIRAAVAEMREKWSKNQDPTNTWYFIGRLAAYDDILRFLDPAAEPEAHNAH